MRIQNILALTDFSTPGMASADARHDGSSAVAGKQAP